MSTNGFDGQPIDGSTHAIGGNYNHSGGIIEWTSSADATLAVTGNVLITGGECRLSNNSGNLTMTASGNFEVGGAGALTETGTATENLIIFNNSGVQIFTSTGTISGDIDFTVNSGTTLQMADASTIMGSSGLGTFTLLSGSSLGIRSINGITTTGATGHIQTSIRNYNSGANYIYNGSTNQAVGDGLPATVGSLTINNSGSGGNNTVILASNIDITNALSVDNGVFAIGSNNVTNVGFVDMTGTAITGTGIITLGGNISTNISTSTASISSPISLGTSTRTFTIAEGAANPDMTISSVISGGGLGIIKNSEGLLLLSGANTFTGGATINAGTVQLGSTGALNSGTPNAVTFGVSSTGTLQLNGNSVTISNLNTNATVGTPIVENNNGVAATLTVNTTGTGIYAGVFRDGGAGAFGLTKNGAGSFTISGNNTYSGTTTLGAGILNINSTTALGTGSFTINGGTIDNTNGGAVALTNNNLQNWNGDFTFTRDK